MNISRIRKILLPLLLIAMLAFLAWTYIGIRSAPKTAPEKDITLSVIPDYRIVSGKTLMLWPAGTVFEQGLAAYFYASAPEVTVTFTIGITGLEQGSLDGTVLTSAFLQAVNDQSEVYWSYPLRSLPEQTFTLSANEAGQASFSSSELRLDVPAAYVTLTDIGNELMFQNGIFRILVTADVSVKGGTDNTHLGKNLSAQLPLTLQNVSFSIPRSQEAAQYTFPKASGNSSLLSPLFNILSSNPLPFLADAVLLLMILLLYFSDPPAKSKLSREHRRYKEWITEGSVRVQDRLNINILSLEGLVDLAIDLDKRVIFDPGIRKYYVLTEDMAYVYDPEHAGFLLENREQLGKLLIRRGLIQPKQLEIGLHYHKKFGIKLGESLTALGFIDETTLYSTLAAQQGIDYYELNAGDMLIDTNRLLDTGIQKARALMAVPLGIRGDGKLAVACGEAARKGIRESLIELFGTQIHLTAAKPSAIYEVFKAAEERETGSLHDPVPEENKAPYERLTKEEQEQFLTVYYRGNIPYALFLKASGLADPALLDLALGQESFLPSLVSKKIISSEAAGLLKGLDKLTENTDWKQRQEKQLPDLLNLLLQSNYLTLETMEWADRELAVQGLSPEQLLLRNYLASESTLRYAKLLLATLESLLLKA